MAASLGGGRSLGRSFVAGLVSPLAGRTIQRCGGRAVLASSSILLALGLVGIGLAQNLIIYLAAWIVIGLGMGAGLYDAAFATLGQIYRDKARSPITTLTLFGGFFEHHLLAGQRFACFIGWLAVCVFHLCWSAACCEFANLLAALAAKYWLYFNAEIPSQ